MANSEERKAGLRRFPVLAAFDLCLKCSHLFNILDARGAISVTERVGVIARIRALAVGVAKAYVDQQKAEGDSAAASEENGSPQAERWPASQARSQCDVVNLASERRKVCFQLLKLLIASCFLCLTSFSRSVPKKFPRA